MSDEPAQSGVGAATGEGTTEPAQMPPEGRKLFGLIERARFRGRRLVASLTVGALAWMALG